MFFDKTLSIAYDITSKCYEINKKFTREINHHKKKAFLIISIEAVNLILMVYFLLVFISKLRNIGDIYNGCKLACYTLDYSHQAMNRTHTSLTHSHTPTHTHPHTHTYTDTHIAERKAT